MRDKIVSLMMLMLIPAGLMAFAFTIQSVRGDPRTWTVDDDRLEFPNADFTSVQAAIDAASEGDSIFVYSGAYYEHLAVNKPLSLVGERKESTVIDGSGENQTVITITANNVIIRGFTAQNTSRAPGTSYAGIKILGRSGCNITGNYVTSSRIGIFVDISQRSEITENEVANTGQGIALKDASDITVEANNISASTVGISLASSYSNLILNNRATDSYFGGHGIHLSSSISNTISGNTLVDNFHGMWLVGSSNNWVVGNTIADNDLLGIELASSSNNTFYHNIFDNNPTPVRVDSESVSIWDDSYPSGGNYWGHYAAVDEKSGSNQDLPGSDGIWDHPYSISENNQDRYPFVYDIEKPTADAGPDQTVDVGTVVFFDATGSTDNVGIVNYEWDFGDGTSGSGFVCNHTYAEPRNFTVTLIAWDAAGYSDEDSAIIMVLPVDGSPFWRIDVIAAVVGIAIVAAIFWKYGASTVGRRRKRKARRTQRRNLSS